MIWIAASVLLLIAAPFVLWPLLTHWTPAPEAGEHEDAAAGGDERGRQLEELELDVASGRLSEAEAAHRRRELRR